METGKQRILNTSSSLYQQVSDQLEKAKTLNLTKHHYNVMKIFPFWKLECFTKGKFKNLNKHCFSGIFKIWDFGNLFYNQIVPDQISEIYAGYGYDELAFNMSRYQRNAM
jgi:hypothetical protein